jgi:glycosyltransferase involved in cell wall biosynthesis
VNGIEALTVVVPCHNEGVQVEVAHREISAALTALPSLEILFVDDGSTDDTLEHIRKVADRDDRVSYVCPSPGTSGSRPHDCRLRRVHPEVIVPGRCRPAT